MTYCCHIISGIGVTLDLLGQKYPAVCACDMYALRVVNPSEEDYEVIKSFISIRREYIEKTKENKKC